MRCAIAKIVIATVALYNPFAATLSETSERRDPILRCD